MLKIYRLFISAIALSVAGVAFAGPPFLTNDADLTPYEQWVAFLYARDFNQSQATFIAAPALELDYGLFDNTQLHLAMQYVTYLPSAKLNDDNDYGLGDTEFSIKQRLIHEADYRPEFSFEPTVELPTGNRHDFLGNGRAWYRLPVEFEKHMGVWTLYGAGGYAFNDAPRASNFPFAGVVVQRALTASFILGGELYTQGLSYHTPVGGKYTMLDFGFHYFIKPKIALLFSGGHTILGDNNQWTGFVGLFFT